MTQFHDQLHQYYRLRDYRDQISSGLFQIHRILTTHFPDIDVMCITKMRNILDDDFNQTIQQLQERVDN